MSGHLTEHHVLIVGAERMSQDSFYRFHSPEEIDLAFANDLDLDHPSAIDTDLFVKVRRCLVLLDMCELTDSA